MRAVLVDDEKSNLQNLKILLEKYCPTVQVIGQSSSVDEATDIINLQQPDLLFLDIQMGKKSGFDLLNVLKYRSFEVIFVTAFDHYGIQAIKFAALDYLLKPINAQELINAVTKAQLKINHKIENEQLAFLLRQLKNGEVNPSKIALPQQQEIRYVTIAEIIRCEADNTYTFFFLANGDKVLVCKSLKEYADLLIPHSFLRTHQSHLVNPKFVKSWLKEDGGMLALYNGDKIPVSRPNREMVKAALA